MEFAGIRRREKEREREGGRGEDTGDRGTENGERKSWRRDAVTEEVNVAQPGIRYRSPKLENFIPVGSVKDASHFVLKSYL